jgi:hypothetical protein
MPYTRGMDRAAFAAELGGIQVLLREHQYLQYAPSGRKEYERKLVTCAEQFAYLVFRMTGVPVKAPPGLVSIESVRDPSYSAGKAMAERAAKRAMAFSKKATGLDREYWARCAALWERASKRLAEPDQP